MIIGMSMGQEICLVLGQVSLSLVYQARNLQKDMYIYIYIYIYIYGPGRD